MKEDCKIVLFIFFKLIFFLSTLIIGIGILLKEDLLKAINLDYETNDFCQRINELSNNTMDKYACDNEFKKDKVILLLIDSLPYDVLYDFHDFKKNKLTNCFRGKGIEYKQSGALFETILTGKFSRNYLASNEMKMDNLQKQFINSKMDTYYKVQHFPIYGLLNKNLINEKKFEKYSGEASPLFAFCDINYGPLASFRGDINSNYNDETGRNFKEGYNHESVYSEGDKRLSDFFSTLRTQFEEYFLKKNISSYIFYSDSLDHINHVTFSKSPLSISSVYILEKIVKEIIKWIDEEHPDYALALVSDHGGQTYYGEDTLCNHGCNHLGNEAVFFVYTKELGENFDKYKIKFENGEAPVVSLNDFVCVFSEILKNFNFPLETTCTPRYLGNDKLLFFTSVKSKEFQLRQYLEKLIKKYPELKTQYEMKYGAKLKNNKYNTNFTDLDAIYKLDENFYNEYVEYLMDIQSELLSDVIKSGQTRTYFIIFYSVCVLFIFGFLYHLRRVIVITKEKVFKEMKKSVDNKNPFLSKLVTYTYFIEIILLIEPFMCIIYNNALNISYYINLSVWIKFFSILCLVILVMFINKIKRNNYKKLAYNIIFIIILHIIATKIELFSNLDKYFITQKRCDYLKRILIYPLLVIYGFIELYSHRNYYFILSNKIKIRYIYVLIPYLLYLAYYFFLFDYFLNINNPGGHSPDDIALMNKIYILSFLLLLFIKPFENKQTSKIREDYQNELNDPNYTKAISSDIINLKLFLFIIIIFICVELEKVEMIFLFNFIVFYLCYCFKNEQDVFIKIIYMILIISYPEIHFIANQGTYTMDTSIKVTLKCPAQWADDKPITMGVIFVVDKFRFNFMIIGYLFSLIKISKKKINYYYTELIRLILNIQSFGFLLCFLYYLKREKEGSYIQILYLIATQLIVVIGFNLFFIINYLIFKFIGLLDYEKSVSNYELIQQENINSDNKKIILLQDK